MRFCTPAFFSKQGKLWDQAICSGLYPVWCWKSPRTNTAQLLWVTSSPVELPSRLKHLFSYKPYTHLLHVCLKLEIKFLKTDLNFIFKYFLKYLLPEGLSIYCLCQHYRRNLLSCLTSATCSVNKTQIRQLPVSHFALLSS